AMINEVLDENESRCLKFKENYDENAYLWKTNLSEWLKAFNDDASFVTEHGQRLLDLKKYDKAICQYEAIKGKIDKMHSPVDIGWLRVNAVQLKSQLQSWVCKWIDMFTGTLKNHL